MPVVTNYRGTKQMGDPIFGALGRLFAGVVKKGAVALGRRIGLGGSKTARVIESVSSTPPIVAQAGRKVGAARAAAIAAGTVRGSVLVGAGTAVGRVATRTGRVIQSQAGRAGLAGAGGAIVGGIIYDKFGNPVGFGRKRKRMNPLNPRALNRAIRRVHSFACFAEKSVKIKKTIRTRKKRRCPT